MKITIENLNNNDELHEIRAISFTTYADGREEITVNFDGGFYRTDVRRDAKNRRYFRYCGKSYNINMGV